MGVSNSLAHKSDLQQPSRPIQFVTWLVDLINLNRIIGELFFYKLFDAFFQRLFYCQMAAQKTAGRINDTIKEIKPDSHLMLSSLNEVKGDFLIKILVSNNVG